MPVPAVAPACAHTLQIETAVRYRLPITFIVVNNNGIYSGIDAASYSEAAEAKDALSLTLPPTSLLPGVRYDRLIEAFGGE
jgi:2-hydroxyacyl-CoA lyase 1